MSANTVKSTLFVLRLCKTGSWSKFFECISRDKKF